MSKLFQILAIASVAVLLCILTVDAATSSGRYNSNNKNKYSSGQYNPSHNDPYYSSKYYKNREYYQNKQYYDNFYKQYNPNVAAAKARIVQQVQEPQHDGAYSYSYETENGIHAEERGVPVNVGQEDQWETVDGSYAFITPEGLRVGVKYTADGNGYHPIITYDGVGAEDYANRQAPSDVVLTRIH